MKIAVPVAAYHPGSTAEYVIRALQRLGHESAAVAGADLPRLLLEGSHDYYFCVDSGEPLPLTGKPFDDLDLSKLAFWFIDYRHNKDRPGRIPNDEENLRSILRRGGTIFQSQREDFEETSSAGANVHFLPLAADPDIWRNHEKVPDFHLGFVGNVWDQGRASVLELLLKTAGLKFLCAKPGRVWKEEASQLLCRCAAGFNVNSFFGTPVAFDVNMRVFETLSSGRPLITNEVPNLKTIFPVRAPFIKTYRSTQDLLPVVEAALNDTSFLSSGESARQWILDNATYVHRMRKAITILTGEEEGSS